MSSFLKKIGVNPIWGNNLRQIIFNPKIKGKLNELRLKKLKNPEKDISKEIEKTIVDSIK